VTVALPRPVLPWAGAAGASIALGAGIALNLQVSFLLVIAFVGVAALAAPAGAWVLCALVAALTFRGLVELNALPSVATFIDLPLAWGALAVGLLKRQERSPLLARHLRWLAALGLAVVLAWAFHPSEVLRPVLYLALLGEPFAIVGALLADPPSPRLRRALEQTLLALLLVQIPLAALQLATLGPFDHIQGTLYGAGAGAHVISAVCVVGAIWILAGGYGREALGAARLPVVCGLLVIPFLADAKQVILAMPAVLLAWTWGSSRAMSLGRIAPVAASMVVLFSLAAPARTVERYFDQSAQGGGGKEATARFVWQGARTDPQSLAFGKGPAETVSRAAYMTTPLFGRADSPLTVLDLKPAEFAIGAESAALTASGGGTSFNSGASSALGVLGDLGILGLLAFVGALMSLFVLVRRQTSADGVAGAAGLALFLVLGLIYDWWEQPPFGVVLGVLAGLALTAERREGTGSAQDTP